MNSIEIALQLQGKDRHAGIKLLNLHYGFSESQGAEVVSQFIGARSQVITGSPMDIINAIKRAA